MKRPFRRNQDDDIDGDEEFYERLMRLTGIPNPAAPPSFLMADVSMQQLMAAMMHTPERATIAEMSYDQPPWAGHTVVSQPDSSCCELNARDGLILYALNTNGAAVVAKSIPDMAHTAFIRILAVDEHTGQTVNLNTDAEAMKRLMNALPGLIKAAEVARDEAVAILAGDQ
jgi:hypothetical protein